MVVEGFSKNTLEGNGLEGTKGLMLGDFSSGVVFFSKTFTKNLRSKNINPQA